MKKEDQDWVLQVWAPKMAKLGSIKAAGIMPENLIQKQVISKMTDDSKSKMENFSSYAEALAWLNK